MDALIAGAQKLVERFDCSMAEALECFTEALNAHDEQAEAENRARTPKADFRLVQLNKDKA